MYAAAAATWRAMQLAIPRAENIRRGKKPQWRHYELNAKNVLVAIAAQRM